MPTTYTAGPTYYETLGVPEDASRERIIAAYRRLSLKYHPDRNKSPDAHERMVELNEAREILCNPAARALYDESLHEARSGVDTDATRAAEAQAEAYRRWVESVYRQRAAEKARADADALFAKARQVAVVGARVGLTVASVAVDFYTDLFKRMARIALFILIAFIVSLPTNCSNLRQQFERDNRAYEEMERRRAAQERLEY